MRVPIAAILLTAALAAAGCGESSTADTADANPPENGKRALSTAETAVVANAETLIRTACTVGQPASAYVEPAKVIAAAVRVAPRGIYESGNSYESLQLRTFAKDLAEQVRACQAPAAAQILQQASKAS